MQLSILEGDSWTKRTARSGFPILVEYAGKRKKITYSEWNDEIVGRGLGSHVVAVQYGRPAGEIGDACEKYAQQTGERVPPINLMVVRKETQVPGTGAENYIRQFCADFLDRDVNPSRLSPREERAVIDRALEEIFDFPSWGRVLKACGLAETNARRSTKLRRRRSPKPSRWKSGPESDEHRYLKRLIVDDPALVGLEKDENAAQEHTLWSGDRLDIYFEHADIGVEVKTAHAGFDEILRGIFQCVKYRAVLRHQQIYDRRIPTADCLLALGGTLPEELQEILDRFGLRYFAQLAE